MVVCKFFLQGNCRYGSNCRFEHNYNSKYVYHAGQTQAPKESTAPSQVTDEQLVNQVRADVQAALKGGQWILSSYTPFKEKPALPGIKDLSPEEARLFIYEAKANNTVDQAVAYMNNLFQDARQKYELLLNPNPSIINTLRGLYKGEVVTSPFNAQNSFGMSNDAASSVFRSAVQSPSVFQNNAANANMAGSIFAQKASSVFGPSPDAAKSIFSQATQNVFGPQPDTFAPDAAKSIFAQASQQVNQNVAPPNQNIFHSQPQQHASSIFATASQHFFNKPAESFTQQTQSSPFAQTSPFQQATATTQNVFQKSEPSNIFRSSAAFNGRTADDTGVYSKMEELSQSDLEAFQSNDFKLGFVPELPPPQALCAL